MNAFTHHSDARVEEICKNDYIPPFEDLLKQYCTLRLDGGRQSGKSTAVTNFAANWLYDGGTVIVLSNTSAYAKISASHIKKNFLVILAMIFDSAYLLILSVVLSVIKEASSEVYRFREFCI